eukprot:CAMPEP_0197661838 /NCGR_PEP_ID=MMETSP1338-20131121/51699_1 /TAXON_ID=43686 ORGANISM="Pelagodinium beii, Strain RCC1491" /NCGR_SAMPLE_ID=MMETSP1338 /ASSEMBLY_ACC=CAM_ASM_000754 /LENGTH=411 /DNA_ID=CAMNT_0043239473 /DNA_START=232 /DNA_END=1467 /DNA_ORIENTATION=+
MADFGLTVLTSVKAVVENRANLLVDVDIQDEDEFLKKVQGSFVRSEVAAVEALLDSFGLQDKVEYIKRRVWESAEKAAEKVIAIKLETLLGDQGIDARALVSAEKDVLKEAANLAFDRNFVFWVTLRDRETIAQFVKKPAVKAAVRHMNAAKLLKLVEEIVTEKIPQALVKGNLTSALQFSVATDPDVDEGVATDPLSFWLKIKVEYMSVAHLLEASKGDTTALAFTELLEKLRKLHGLGVHHIDRAVEGIHEGIDQKALLFIKEKLAESVSKLLGEATPMSLQAYQALRDYAGAVPGRCCGDRRASDEEGQKIRARWVSRELLLGAGAGYSMLGRWGHCPRLDYLKDCADDNRWKSSAGLHLERTHHLASRECFEPFLAAVAAQESEKAEYRDYSSLLGSMQRPTTLSCY